MISCIFGYQICRVFLLRWGQGDTLNEHTVKTTPWLWPFLLSKVQEKEIVIKVIIIDWSGRGKRTRRHRAFDEKFNWKPNSCNMICLLMIKCNV